MLFYESELDFVFEDLNLIAKEYPMHENDYNNIIEVIPGTGISVNNFKYNI